MKRLVVCISCLLLVFGGCILITRWYLNRSYMASITSFDELTTIQFGNIASDEPEYQQTYFRTLFTLIDNCNFYEECVKGKPYYVCSLTKDLKPCDGATGYYLLKQDKHWFLAETSQQDVCIHELISAFYTDTCGVFPVPFILPGLPHSEPIHVSWDEMLFVDSFEELISFYTDLDYPMEISADEESFFLSAYYADRINSHTLMWYPSCIEVKKESDGISMSLIKNQTGVNNE